MRKVKIVLVIFLLLLVSASLFSEEVVPCNPDTDDTYRAVSFPFIPNNPRFISMGMTGVASPEFSEALFVNPAKLGDNKFFISIPSASFTLYNDKKILEEKLVDNIKSVFTSESEEERNKNFGDASEKLLNILNRRGYNELMTIDGGIDLGFCGFGSSFDGQFRFITYANGYEATELKVILNINVAASLGYGFKIKFNDNFSLDLGLGLTWNYRAYNEGVSFNTISDILNGMTGGEDMASVLNNLLGTTPMMAGWAAPVKIGARLNIPCGIKLGCTVSNIDLFGLGKFHMNAYPSISKWSMETIKTPLQIGDGGEYNDGENVEFSFTSPLHVDVGFSWNAELVKNLISMTLNADFSDIIYYSQNKDNIFNHLSFGAEFEFFNVIALRAGYHGSGFSLGLGLDLYVLRVEASYSWNEFGKTLGEKPVDQVTIKVTLGH